MKKIRFSFVKSVSGDLHVLHVTYSTGASVRVVSKTHNEVRTYLYTSLTRFLFASVGTGP